MQANNVYQNGTNGIVGNNVLMAPGLVPGGIGSFSPAMQLSVNTVDAVTESIKSDRTIRMWKVEAMKVYLKACRVKQCPDCFFLLMPPP